MLYCCCSAFHCYFVQFFFFLYFKIEIQNKGRMFAYICETPGQKRRFFRNTTINFDDFDGFNVIFKYRYYNLHFPLMCSSRNFDTCVDTCTSAHNRTENSSMAPQTLVCYLVIVIPFTPTQP